MKNEKSGEGIKCSDQPRILAGLVIAGRWLLSGNISQSFWWMR
jgi:hypothetical protein